MDDADAGRHEGGDDAVATPDDAAVDASAGQGEAPNDAGDVSSTKADAATKDATSGTDAGEAAATEHEATSTDEGGAAPTLDGGDESTLVHDAAPTFDGQVSSSDGYSEKPDCDECDPVPVVNGLFGVSDFTLLGPLIYYTDTLETDEGPVAGPLLKVPVTGGSPAQVTQANLPPGNNQLAAAGSTIFAAPYSIWTVPILGAIEAIQLENAPSYITDLRVNGTHVFALWSLSQMYVTRVSFAGDTTNLTALTPNFDWVDFEVDDEHVYLLTATSLARVDVDADDGGDSAVVGPVANSDESLRDLALSGSGGITIASSRSLSSYASWSSAPSTLYEGPVAEVVSDSAYAYFVAPASEGCETGASLYAVAHTGGRARLLATLSQCPRRGSVTHDADRVYWLSEDTTAILSAEK